ncbi:MAG: hypothetical protein ABI333_05200 [bacterium]
MSSLGLLTTLDLVLVAAALVATVAVGMVVGRRVQTLDDYLTAGRRFPSAVIALTLSATLASALLLAGGLVAFGSRGLAAARPLVLGWLWLPLVIFVWAPILQRNRLITAPQYLGRRFSAGTRRAGAVLSILLLLTLLSAELAIFGATLRALTGTPALFWVVVATGAVVLYAAWGGQLSLIFTNLLQAAVVLVALVLGVALGLAVIDFGNLWQSTPVSLRTMTPEPLLHSASGRALGALAVDALLITVVGVLASQALVGRLVAARGERAAGSGALVAFGPVALLLAVAVVFLGLLSHWLVALGRIPAGEPSDAILAAVLGAISAPGSLGLLVAGLLLAVLSTADSLLIGVTAIVTVDFAAEALPAQPPRRRLQLARLTTLATAAVAFALAILLDWLGNVATLATLLGAILGGPLGLVLAAGMISRRLGRRTALAALVVGTVSGLVPLLWLDGPHPTPVDAERCALTALAGTLLALLVGRLLVWRRTPPVRLNLTWRNLTPAWPQKRATATLAPGGARASSGATAAAGGDSGTGAGARAPSGATATADSGTGALPQIALSKSLLDELSLKPGHQVHVTAAGCSWFGLRSFRAEVAKGPAAATDRLEAPPKVFQRAGLTEGAKVVIERVA